MTESSQIGVYERKKDKKKKKEMMAVIHRRNKEGRKEDREGRRMKIKENKKTKER